MLVLSRKRNEQIVIDDHIVVTVVAVLGGKVRLGIQAPGDIPIYRKEIQDARDKEAAASAAKLPT